MHSYLRVPRLRVLLSIGSVVAALPLSTLSPVAAPASGQGANLPAGFAMPGPMVIDDLTTERSLTYLMPDGTFQATDYTSPVMFKDARGAWRAIDTTLMATPGQTYAAQNAAGSYVAKIPKNPSTTPVSFSTDGYWVTMRMHGATTNAPVIHASTAVLNDVREADSVSYEATGYGLKESINLSHARAGGSPSYAYTVDASPGLTPSIDAGSGNVVFTAPDGTVPVTIPAATMHDSAEPAAESADISYTLVQTGDKWTLSMQPDADWLTAPSRQYPVVIDPSLSKELPKRDCWIGSGAPNTPHCAAPYMHIGGSDAATRNRALIDFDVSSVPANAVVSSAAAHLFLDSSQSLNHQDADYALFRAGKAFDANATWNTAGAAGTWTGGDPVVASMSPRVGLSGVNSGFKTFDLTNIAQDWVDGSARRTGLVLKQANADGSDTNNVLYLISDADGNLSTQKPYLDLDYTVPPTVSTPGYVAASPCTDPCWGDWLVATSATPLLEGPPNPDSGSHSYTFQIRSADTQAVLATSPAESVSPNATPAWTVPAGILGEGLSYEVRISASSSPTVSDSAWFPLTVDLAHQPAAPSDLSLSPCDSPCEADATTTSLTPILSAILGDADSSLISTAFDVRDVATGQTVASGAGTLSAPGGESDYQVPAGVLQDGRSYEFGATATDAAGGATSSDWRSFTISEGPSVQPTNIAVDPCSTPCALDSVVTSLTPRLTATNPASNGAGQMIFEVQQGEYVASSGPLAVEANGSAAWSVPAGEFDNGDAQYRAGFADGGVTAWSPWTSMTFAASPDSQPDFPTSDDVRPEVAAGSDPEANQPFVPDPTLDAEDDPLSTPLTDDQVVGFNAQAFPAGSQLSATPMQMIQNYAPILYLDSEEKYGPMSAYSFLNHATLDWNHSCGGDDRLSSRPNSSKMSAGSYGDEQIVGREFPFYTCNRTHKDPWYYSNDPAVRPHGKGGPGGGEGIYLDLQKSWRDGAGEGQPPFGGNEPTYYRYVPEKYIMYAFAYGDSAIANPGEEAVNHEGDWEFYWVLLDVFNRPTVFEYEIHGKECVLRAQDAPAVNNHAQINVGNHSHANYPRGYSVRVDDDATGDGPAWHTANNLVDATSTPWWKYTGAWGQAGRLEVTSGPEGPNPEKSAPNYDVKPCTK